ncbi:MAG: GNAT family N-acetyltransferase [Novosphingobium sp.]|nr:GNAT family N-acetyltransferase [Novosphingobium sp.]
MAAVTDFALETPRLVLRDWREGDLDPFAAMCADPRVMATLGPLLSREETAALIGRLVAIAQVNGYTQWALERRDDGRFLGWCGLNPGTFWPLEGRIEVGWRLIADCWGQGYAREAAQAALVWGFERLAPDAIWAITAQANRRSRGLMERLGMVRHPELDFDHPKVPDGSPLKPHVAYSIARRP